MKGIVSKISTKENQIVFTLNTKVYPLEVIYSAAYIFLDRAYIFLDGDPTSEITIHLKGKKKLTSKQLENLKGEFLNELLSYLLRTEIAKRNQKVREAIVGGSLISALPNAYSIMSATQSSSESWKDDPLGIRKKWEEKNNKIKS